MMRSKHRGRKYNTLFAVRLVRNCSYSSNFVSSVSVKVGIICGKGNCHPAFRNIRFISNWCSSTDLRYIIPRSHCFRTWLDERILCFAFCRKNRFTWYHWLGWNSRIAHRISVGTDTVSISTLEIGAGYTTSDFRLNTPTVPEGAIRMNGETTSFIEFGASVT